MLASRGDGDSGGSSVGASPALVARATVQTLCRVALDGAAAAQHGVADWVRGPALEALVTSAVLRAPLADFTDLLGKATGAARAAPAADTFAQAADSPNDASDASVISSARLRELARLCQRAEQNGLSNDLALHDAIVSLQAGYGVLCRAFGLTGDGPALSGFVAALAFDVEMLVNAPGLTPEQQQFASFRELMRLYQLI
jgi:hypothetical protein